MSRKSKRAFGSRLSTKALKRGMGSREPARSFLVVCEGAVTEKEYIETVKNELRYQPVEVEIHAGNPNTAREIVAYAVARMKAAKLDAERLGDALMAFDEVWCVFDGGEHPREDEARIQARDNRIHLAVSCPSAELWVLLHKVDQNASLTSHQALSLCRKHKLMSGKHILEPTSLYRESYEDAKAHSTKLRRARLRDGNPCANPSTDFDLLIESIRRAKRGKMTHLELS